jgi:hypothetical protein
MNEVPMPVLDKHDRGLSLAGGGTNCSVNGLGSGRFDLFQASAKAPLLVVRTR